MEERIYTIIHKGKRIYVSDWRDLKKTEEAVIVMNYTADFIASQGQYGLLELIDARGSYSPPAVLIELKKVAKRTELYSRRKAIVGISKTKLILLNSVNRLLNNEIRGFDSIEVAKDWLVQK